MSELHAKEHPDFITVTCLEWKPVLSEDRFKEIIIDSLRFLFKEKRVCVYAFVIMSNHFHLIWQILANHKPEDVQRDFLKYTGQQILKVFRNEKHVMQDQLLVNAKVRKYQVWERNSLRIPVWTSAVIKQKLDYIHQNPVKAGLCQFPEGYHYSSASFYHTNNSPWEFVSHVNGN